MIVHSISWQCKNGASHRKNFDTPSLEGYWRGTLVPRCELTELAEFTRYSVSYKKPAIGGTMQTLELTNVAHTSRLRGRETRSRSIGTKLTPSEEKKIIAAAEAQGKAPSEWARDLLLRGAIADNRSYMELHIFTELVGIEMLMMKTLEPILRGEKLEEDQIAMLFRQVQSTKTAKAQELLARRSQKQEK
jgi:hypothetical protein